MQNIPSAQAFYPKHYSIQLDKNDLNGIGSEKFRTHRSIHAQRLHKLSEALLLPGRLAVQLLAKAVQPLAGKNKEKPAIGVLTRIGAITGCLFLLPVVIPSLLLSLPLRRIEHHLRPAVSYLKGPDIVGRRAIELTPEKPLHVRSHNIGFVTTSMSTSGDLRSPVKRAHELVESINGDPEQPDLIFFQEAFHEDGVKVLCEGIQKSYPHIIHSVAPHFSGFNSGAMVASKYPIEEVEFKTFAHMLGPEKASPRGVIRVKVATNKGPMYLYGVHTQALIGQDRAESRFRQIKDLKDWMAEDLRKFPNISQVVLGDFNTSRLTAWGEDALEPKGQSEEKVLNRLNEEFDDLFLRDHDPKTGKRIKDQPEYLPHDVKRAGYALEEPQGSWYHGPFADPGPVLTRKMRKDREKHQTPAPAPVEGLVGKATKWGTKEWQKEQRANTARFDFILLPKNDGLKKLDGRVEIRRVIVPEGVQSASTDHLPVDGRIWML